MITTIIEAIFGAALFINALLFIPQIIKIIREKSSQGVSLITFVGFLLIQLSAVLYGLVKQDMVLVLGYLISIVTCGTVVILALIYKPRVREEAGLSLEDIIEQLRRTVTKSIRKKISLYMNFYFFYSQLVLMLILLVQYQ